jgi:hypothetical protein
VLPAHPRRGREARKDLFFHLNELNSVESLRSVGTPEKVSPSMEESWRRSVVDRTVPEVKTPVGGRLAVAEDEDGMSA